MLIGAAAYGLASSISLEGPAVAGLPLTGPDEGRSASVRGVLQHHALSALQTCPDDALGATEREELLTSYGSEPFELARQEAVSVLAHHARLSGETGLPHPTIRDRAPSMARAREDTGRVDVEAARRRQQLLATDGRIWVVYDGGLSRLPVLCGRCQARTGLKLRIDPEAGSIRVICPDGHVTQDPRLTIAGVQETIGVGDRPAPGTSRSPARPETSRPQTIHRVGERRQPGSPARMSRTPFPDAAVSATPVPD